MSLLTIAFGVLFMSNKQMPSAGRLCLLNVGRGTLAQHAWWAPQYALTHFLFESFVSGARGAGEGGHEWLGRQAEAWHVLL